MNVKTPRACSPRSLLQNPRWRGSCAVSTSCHLDCQKPHGQNECATLQTMLDITELT